MTPQQFIKKWEQSKLTERAAAQSHFNDLCAVLGEPTPTDADPEGTWYCFEKGAKKTGGGDGWADVWKRGHFAWEYKRKGKDLNAAFVQLQHYAIALENPPLLVVSDLDTILIYTNFTNTVQEIHRIPIAEIGASTNLEKLRWLFTEPERLRPGATTAAVTEEAAGRFAKLAQRLRDRGHEPHQVAHFLNKILFCLFAEDSGLLPARLFVRLLETAQRHPERTEQMMRSLLGAMVRGGNFGADLIEWFNGGLFDSDDVLPLTEDDVKELLSVSRLNWSSIEPSIFGTLFERGLDPSKRSELGAQYTDPQTIMRLVTPVVVGPLLKEWEHIKAQIGKFMEGVPEESRGLRKTKHPKLAGAEKLFSVFLHRLGGYRVLDPACGSGNFLYLALQALKDIEHRATLEGEELGLQPGFTGMNVGVQCLHGIEINSYAAELARVTVWIGEIQWMLKHGVQPSKNPILKPLETIECRDAILKEDGTEPVWPKVDAIVGNPPFLGGKMMRSGLGDEYVEKLFALYDGRVPAEADLVTYWFEKARAMVEIGSAARAGLVATNSIRGGASRKVLERVLASGRIFEAWSDEDWINEGAAVRVSLVCFTHGQGNGARLDGRSVPEIYADLTATGVDLTKARRLKENSGVAFMGDTKGGAFDVTGDVARAWLVGGGNPNGRPNSDVLRQWINGLDLTRRPRGMWIIDFGWSMDEAAAARYEAPFAHISATVKPERENNRREAYARFWWRHVEPRPGMWAALNSLRRYVITPTVAKHRVFGWSAAPTCPDHQLIVIARSDDVAFGVLHSRFHEVWALGLGTWLGVGNDPRYTPTTTFETFPFPEGLTLNLRPEQYVNPHAAEIGAAAMNLNEQRENWLNPPEWVERLPEVVAGYPDRLIPKEGKWAQLKKRTLTNLYNERPAWLLNAHRELDAAVAKAYGWADYTPDMPDEEILRRLLALNLERASLKTAVETAA